MSRPLPPSTSRPTWKTTRWPSTRSGAGSSWIAASSRLRGWSAPCAISLPRTTGATTRQSRSCSWSGNGPGGGSLVSRDVSAAVRRPGGADVRLRAARRRAGAVPRRDRARRRRDRPAPHPDPPRRRGDLALADDPRGPHRPAAGAPRRARVLLLAAGLVFAASPCSSCCSSRRRSASSAPAATRSGRSSRSSRRRSPSRRPDRDARACSRATSSSARSRPRPGALAAGVVAQARRRPGAVPADAYRAVDRRLRGRRHRARAAVPARVPGRRGAGRRASDASVRTRLGLHRSQRRRAPAVGAVRAGRVRRRVRHAELHRVLVPASGSGWTRPASAAILVRAPTCSRRRLGARGRRRSPRASGSSGRWSSRTCPRTCC